MHKLASMSFSTFSRKLLSVSASDCRFNFIMVDISIEACLCTHLASDHSKVNGAILLSCLHNIFVFVSILVSISLSSNFEFLCSTIQVYFLDGKLMCR